jgi:hypothetical protein
MHVTTRDSVPGSVILQQTDEPLHVRREHMFEDQAKADADAELIRQGVLAGADALVSYYHTVAYLSSGVASVSANATPVMLAPDAPTPADVMPV